MIGIFYALTQLFAYGASEIKETSYVVKKRADAEVNGDITYRDYQGRERLLSNNHIVFRTEYAGYNVLKDCKTGQIVKKLGMTSKMENALRQQEYLKEQIENAKKYEEKSKKEAIEKGYTVYRSYKVENKNCIQIYKRLSDDYELKDCRYGLEDTKTPLILCVSLEAQITKNDFAIRRAKNINHSLIDSGDGAIWSNMTEEEFKEYAKQIGAIL